MAKRNTSIKWNDALIKRYNLAGPRYTSYPTAPQFDESFSTDELNSAIARSNQKAGPLSLYFHIPFCDTVCYYCACNKIITANRQRAIPYLARLHEEVQMKSKLFDRSRPVTQLHWGGGTPTYLSLEQMQWLMNITREHFSLLSDDSGEYSIEIHPRGVNKKTIEHLRKIGFNRLSMGVQDFNLETQKAVNRFNSEEEVARLVESIRAQEFHSLSMDLIYGLPLQTVESFRATLDAVIALSPDRISLFNYAHLPHLFKTQRQIDELALPSAHAKLEILHMSIEKLCAAGYVYIGMDHFAKPGDSLVIAQGQGELQRNFQGYSTHANSDLIGFGVSSISSIDNIYVQNYKRVDDYNQAIDTRQLPLSSGIELTQDDTIRQKVIHHLICQFVLDFDIIESQFSIRFEDYFKDELKALKLLAEDELISIDERSITVLDQGRLLVRRVCMIFDAYLARQPEIRYSQII